MIYELKVGTIGAHRIVLAHSESNSEVNSTSHHRESIVL